MSQPWFPFYVGDYVRDTARLSTEGHGAYLLLMLDYWANGAPPDDDETLSSIARLSPDAWLKLRQKLVSFFQIADGRWTHKRIDKEREIAEEKHQKRVNAGKAGGEAKAKVQQSSSNASPEPQALPYQSQPQPHPLKKDTRAATPSKNENFENFKKDYPKRAGNYGWKAAERKYLALVKTGVDPGEINAANRRHAEEMRKLKRIGTEYVPMPASWLNSEDFVEMVAFEPKPIDWDALVKGYRDIGRWPTRDVGNDPSSPACRAPLEILRKYGFEPVIPALRAMEA